MQPFPPRSGAQPSFSRTFAIVRRRRALATRALGLLALYPRITEEARAVVLHEALGIALALPQYTTRQLVYKAQTLFHMTALLARLQLVDAALLVAPHIPLAPGTAEVLEFEVPRTRQFYQWRVDPARALVAGRVPHLYSVATLALPYRRGFVTIDHDYLRTAHTPKLTLPQPILLLPHPFGMVEVGGQQLVILDGNHRVVWAWHHRRATIPGILLTEREAAAILYSYAHWPPYGAARSSKKDAPL